MRKLKNVLNTVAFMSLSMVDRGQTEEKAGGQLRTEVEGYGQFPRETDLPDTGV